MIQNKILSLIDDNGVEIFSKRSKSSISTCYFNNLFTSSNPEQAIKLLDGMEVRVTNAMNEELMKSISITSEEV